MKHAHPHSVTTRQAAELKSRLQAQIHVLTQLDHGKATRAIIAQWLIIVATATTAIYLHHWAFYLLAIVIIGGRQHALAVLMHERHTFDSMTIAFGTTSWATSSSPFPRREYQARSTGIDT